MTREEALGYLGAADHDDPEDAYEEQLFAYKQFFLSKAPILKLYEGRIGKLRKLGEAYRTVSGNMEEEQQGINVPDIGTGDILEVFLAFQKSRSGLRKEISSATSAPRLIMLSLAMVALEKEHASRWYNDAENDEEVIVSREPDPMYLLEAIKAYRAAGGETFSQLKNRENNPPELLVQEMKRLSLLFKKF